MRLKTDLIFMNVSQTKLKALVLMLVFVLGLTVFERAETIAAFLETDQQTANIFNPVAAFLGIPTSNNSGSNYESLQTQDPFDSAQNDGDSYFGSTPDDPFGGGGSTTLINTPAPSNAQNTDLSGGVASTQTGAGTTGSLKSRTPTLVCLPSVLSEGEEAIIMWACRDGAYKATSPNIATEDAVIGSARVRPGADTTYELTCENNLAEVDNTSATCKIEVAKPALAIIATPSRATRGSTVTLSWKTKDTNACVVTSDEHTTFERGGVEGDALSPALRENTTFTLTCETITGAIEERSITIGVN